MSREDADRAHWPAWSGDEINRTVQRIHLFMRRGIGAAHAEHLAERLLLRDRESENRQVCVECSHYRPGRCGNHRAAGLLTNEVGRDLATLLQRCPGINPLPTEAP